MPSQILLCHVIVLTLFLQSDYPKSKLHMYDRLKQFHSLSLTNQLEHKEYHKYPGITHILNISIIPNIKVKSPVIIFKKYIRLLHHYKEQLEYLENVISRILRKPIVIKYGLIKSFWSWCRINYIITKFTFVTVVIICSNSIIIFMPFSASYISKVSS